MWSTKSWLDEVFWKSCHQWYKSAALRHLYRAAAAPELVTVSWHRRLDTAHQDPRWSCHLCLAHMAANYSSGREELFPGWRRDLPSIELIFNLRVLGYDAIMIWRIKNLHLLLFVSQKTCFSDFHHVSVYSAYLHRSGQLCSWGGRASQDSDFKAGKGT